MYTYNATTTHHTNTDECENLIDELFATGELFSVTTEHRNGSFRLNIKTPVKQGGVYNTLAQSNIIKSFHLKTRVNQFTDLIEPVED